MRLIGENIEISGSHQLVAGDNHLSVTLPATGDRSAFRAKRIFVGVASTSAAPTVTAGGIYKIGFALGGDNEPNELENVVDMVACFAQQGNAAAAGVVDPLFHSSQFPMGHPMDFTLFAALFTHGFTVNITNPPLLLYRILVDAYQLTTTEYIDIID